MVAGWKVGMLTASGMMFLTIFTEMDTLFEDAPLFVANTPYAKTQNR